MPIVHQLAWFAGGAALANAVPHFVHGLSGRAFQSPFASPPGIGLSSSIVNVVWGFCNLVIGYVLLTQVGAFDGRSIADAMVPALGALVLAVPLSWHFSRVHDRRQP